MKFEEGKPDPSLFYTSALYETVQVRAYGIEKYKDPEGWKTTKPIQHFNAAIRHIRAAMDGEPYDIESKKLHLAHAICDCMFEIERFKNPDIKPKETPICIECKKNLVCERSSSLCWSCFSDGKIYKKHYKDSSEFRS